MLNKESKYSLSNELHKFILIGLGSIPGALIRWQINNDFSANLIGSALLGLLIGLNIRYHYKLVFCIGFCGSLTTFSAWIMKTFDLLIAGAIYDYLLASLLPLFFGIIFVSFFYWMGFNIRRVKPFR